MNNKELCELYTVDEALDILRDEESYAVEIDNAQARILYAIENEGYTLTDALEKIAEELRDYQASYHANKDGWNDCFSSGVEYAIDVVAQYINGGKS